MADGNGSERRDLDGYFTPDELATALVNLLEPDGFWNGGTILEPSAGKGAFIRAADRLLPQYVRAVDLSHDRAVELHDLTHDVQELDFLTMLVDRPFELIIGNPPYSEAEKHVRHALAFRARFGVVAFLLRLGFLESEERAPFWQEHPASKVYVLSQRPSFTGNGKTDRGQAYGFFVWSSWWRHPTALEVVSWRQPKRRSTPTDCRPPLETKTPAELGFIEADDEDDLAAKLEARGLTGKGKGKRKP